MNMKNFRKFWFGKYKGKEICGIAMTHTGYILWLLENTQFKLNEIEQECFDAAAKAKVEGTCNYVFNKHDLCKYIKNKNIDTPFVSIKNCFGILKSHKDTKIAKIFIERYNNKNYDQIPVNVNKVNGYDILKGIHKTIFENDFDDPMSEICILDEHYNDASSMSAFLY